MTRRFASNLLALFFGCTLTLIVWETAFRIAATVIPILQSADVFGCVIETRILVLGESTSANLWDRQGSWPEELQKLLKRDAATSCFRVVNEARPGTNSALILARVPELLERYKPAYVLAMMGINDSGMPFVWQPTSNGNIASLAGSLRIFRVLHWLREKYFAANAPADPNPKLRALLNEGQQLTQNGDYQKAEEIYRRALAQAKTEQPQVLLLLSATLLKLNRAEEARDALQRAFSDSYVGDLHFAELMRVDDALKLPDGEFAKTFEKFELPLARAVAVTNLDPLAFHYRALEELSRRSGAQLIAIQYPTLSAEILKTILRTAPRVDIVENRAQFEAAILIHGRDSVFTDQFASCKFLSSPLCGDFGHTTKLGNTILAKKVYATLREEVLASKNELKSKIDSGKH